MFGSEKIPFPESSAAAGRTSIQLAPLRTEEKEPKKQKGGEESVREAS